jgi:hypothetical protein
MAVHPGTSAYERFDSPAYIHERARDWNFEHTLITDLDRAQGMEADSGRCLWSIIRS